MIISVIGGSGSGKDTQAGYISERFGVPNISMGNILREEKRKGNPLAVQAMEIADQGKWVPDQITSQILEDFVVANCPDGFVITGYPRPVEQIQSLDRIAAALNQEVAAIVHIHVPDEVLMDRMRKQAAEAAKSDDVRADTAEEIMRARLKSYHDTINPLLEEYKGRGILVDIDGTPSIEEVKHDILTQLEELIGTTL